MLRAFETYQGDFAVKQALCFAPHVFLRPQNIRMLQWAWIDSTNSIISIPQDFMKMSRPHLVPLSRQAFDILESMKPLTGSKQYVFSAGLNDKPLSENTLSNAVKRAINPKTGKPLGKGFSTAHGLRHMASTLLNEMRFDSDAIELQLSHLDKDRIRRTYNKSNLIAERTKMMQSWSDYLDKLKAEFN